MNCVQFQDVVHDLARNAGLDESTLRRALAHADSCPRCDELLAEAQSLTGALRSLAASEATSEAPQHVEETLRDAFRRERSVRSMRVRPWFVASVAGIAAAAVLSIILLRHQGVTLAKQDGSAGTTAANGTATGPRTTGSPTAGSNSSADANDAIGSGTEVWADLDTNDATSFVSLPFGDDLAPPEDGAIVRVSLPPSALARYGLPVSATGGGDNIEADFIVGEDGTPRAVRLVR
ncbi:MAG: hypothetical protein WCA98_13220 [Candidatus Acidiferrales bacterium]